MAIEHKAKGDRDGRGRFAKGWKGGPGRKPRPVEEHAIETFRKACGAEDLEAIIGRLVADAKAGQTRAAEIVLRLALGTKTIAEIERELGTRAATALARRSDADMVRALILDPRWRPLFRAELERQEAIEKELEHEQEDEEQRVEESGTEPGDLN